MLQIRPLLKLITLARRRVGGGIELLCGVFYQIILLSRVRVRQRVRVVVLLLEIVGVTGVNLIAKLMLLHHVFGLGLGVCL